LKLQLLPFQKQALHCMLKAERHIYGAVGDAAFSPSDKPFPLLVKDADALLLPKLVGYGGLLCEQMGLGKTIICLALMAANPLDEAVRHARADKDRRLAFLKDVKASVKDHEARLAHLKEHGAVLPPLPASEDLRLLPLDARSPAVAGRLMSGATLVVCPMILVSQWEAELKKHAPSLRVCVYHGGSRLRVQEKLACYDVVLTSYGTMSADFTQLMRKYIAAENTFSAELPGKKLGPALFAINWHRIILDESHILRAATTKQSRAANALSARFRWSVSATPGRTMKDITRHLHFVIGEDPSRASFDSRLTHVASYFIIRHVADQMLGGRRVLELPPRTMQTVYVTLTATERQHYESLAGPIDGFYRQLRQLSGVRQAQFQILAFLQTLRRAASGGAVPNLPDVDIDALLDAISHRIPRAALGRPGRYVELDATGDVMDASSHCPICLDVPDVPVVTACKHLYCYPCLVSLMSSTYEKDKVPCPLCRRVVKIKDLKRLHLDATVDDGGADGATAADGAAAADPQPPAAKRAKQVRGSRRKGRRRAAEDGDDDDNDDDDDEEEGDEEGGSAAAAGVTVLTASAVEEACARDLPLPRGAVGPSDLLERQPFSSKLCKALALVRSALEEDPSTKILLFSHFQSTLNLLYAAMPNAGLKRYMLSSTMTRAARAKEIESFVNADGGCVFLASMRTCAVGINLTAANVIVFMEPAVNPSMRVQAVGRAHRLGQKRAVKVVTLCVKGTVEEALHKLATPVPTVPQVAESAPQASASLFTLSDYDALFRFTTM
jgi:SNF2 family DNA or RNA helicase